MESLLKYALGQRRVEVYEPEIPSDHPPVVIVHGLLHRRIVMRTFAAALRRAGRKVYVYDYKTTRKPVEAHGVELADFLMKLDCPKLDIVTHSMGGLLTRVALDRLARQGRLDGIGRVVMLAPPHHGSEVASWWVSHFPPSRVLVRSLPDLADTPEAAVHRLPVPSGVEIGIIVGSRDSKVSESSTRLGTECDRVVIDSAHAFMMNKPEAQRLILNFLDFGCFEPDKIGKK